MHDAIVFTIPSVPVAQPRQRHRIMQVNGRAFPHNYTPSKHPVVAFKAAVQLAYAAASIGRAPLAGPVRLEVMFFMPRPQRIVWKKRPMPRAWADGNPNDLDNLEKAVQDALKALAWGDDKQVVDKHTWKLYARGDEPPHCVVKISACEEWLDIVSPVPESEYA